MNEVLLNEIDNVIQSGDAGFDEFATSQKVFELIEKYITTAQENEDYENRENKTVELRELFKAMFNENYMKFMRDEFGDNIDEVMWMVFCHGFFSNE